MARTQKAFSAERNIDRVQAVLDRRASGAAGIHGDRRTKRNKTRSAVLRSELRLQGVRF